MKILGVMLERKKRKNWMPNLFWRADTSNNFKILVNQIFYCFKRLFHEFFCQEPSHMYSLNANIMEIEIGVCLSCNLIWTEKAKILEEVKF